MTRETVIAADIGGTNTRLFLYEILVEEIATTRLSQGREAPGTLLLHKKYHNQDYETFVDILKAFLSEAYVSKPPVAACLAVAGPVKDNVVRFTNRLDWAVDGSVIAEQLNIKSVKLINDFQANGYGLLTLDIDKECVVIQKGEPNKSAPIACIGAGTGLGECFLVPSPSGEYMCYPTEGGHAEFAPRNDLEIGLLQFLKKRFSQWSKNRVSVERVVSGTGFVNIYEYLRSVYPDQISEVVEKELEQAGDFKGGVISGHSSSNELCRLTMEIFLTAYGSEAGVAGLKWLPYGGLYLTGGLTPKFIDLIKDVNGPFYEAFNDKGRVSGMLSGIPIYAVMEEFIGVRGAHLVAYQDLAAIYKEQQAGSSRQGSVAQEPSSSTRSSANSNSDGNTPASQSRSSNTGLSHSDYKDDFDVFPTLSPADKYQYPVHRHDQVSTFMQYVLPMSIAFLTGITISQFLQRYRR